MKHTFCVAFLMLFVAPWCQAQEQPDMQKKPAEALLQKVNAELSARPPLRAELTWIKSYYSYGTDGGTPSYYRSKMPLVVIRQNAGLDQFVSSRGRSFKAALSDVLRHLGDPFLPYLQSGFPSFTNPIFVEEPHCAGTEKKNGAVYQVLEAKVVIVSDYAVSPQSLNPLQAPKALFTVTDWRWDIGSDNLVHRFTWENHEDEGDLQSVEQNEVIVNKFYYP